MPISEPPVDEPMVYDTPSGLRVKRTAVEQAYADAAEPLVDRLDRERGVLFASSFEYPGRYTRWDMGFASPPLVVESKGSTISVTALNERGGVLLNAVEAVFSGEPHLCNLRRQGQIVECEVARTDESFPEELRSKQPTVFSALRALIAGLGCADDPHLGLYGSFGYELTFQFDAIRLKLERDPDQRDLVLYVPDDILLVDHRAAQAYRYQYDFEFDAVSTNAMERSVDEVAFCGPNAPTRECDHEPGQYADTVRLARENFARGDLFEVVPGQTFFEPCQVPPSELFRRLRERNPAPYGALLNLGAQEYLVAASPEMYVRVDGRRIETCPISGTIARGKDAIEDAHQILELLNSEKETAELTMCTDVDRNDKSRVCEPGTVKVIGRRQIEMYSRLIHTVDHVEGQLGEGYDALDGFLAHTWAVTVTGAPKHAAIQFIEDHEHSPRRWYGGAIGLVGFDGNMNTGLTLRTMRIKDGVCEVRAGATLLFDSDPDAEEAETRLKASALIDAIRRGNPPAVDPARVAERQMMASTRILMIDHRDSFVHTLASYLREYAGEVTTLRPHLIADAIDSLDPDLVVLSPGPGTPDDFEMRDNIQLVLDRGKPIFGVCLGLQGIVEYFGGTLATLGYPMHGKPSVVTPGLPSPLHSTQSPQSTRVAPGESSLFNGLPESFVAGRYHSLFADKETFPSALRITATTADGTIMAIEHETMPIAAVQFHPESILTLEGRAGHQLIENVIKLYAAAAVARDTEVAAR